MVVDGDKYEMIQTVTDRGSSYYNSTLLIRHAADLAGNHTYTCTITNNAGTTTQSIETTMTGYYYIIIIIYRSIINTSISRYKGESLGIRIQGR